MLGDCKKSRICDNVIMRYVWIAGTLGLGAWGQLTDSLLAAYQTGGITERHRHPELDNLVVTLVLLTDLP